MDQTQQQQQQAQQPSQQQNPQPRQQVSAAANTASATTATTTDVAMQQQHQQQQQEPRLQQQQKFVPTDSSSDSDRAAKKSAQLGQWRTPPQPFFPSNPSATSATTVAPAPAATAVIQSSAPVVAGGPQPMSTIPSASASTTAGAASTVQAGPGGVAPAAVGGGAATAAVAAATGAASSSSGDAGTTAGGGSGGSSDLGDFDLASLQEAYRRGMEAARALSQHQLATGQNVFVEPMGTATSSSTLTTGATAPTTGAPPAPAPAAVIVGSSASCPNLQELNAAQRQQQQTAAYKPSGVMEEPDPQQQPHPHHQAQAQQQFGSGYQPHAHPGAAFVAPPAPSAPATASVQQQQPYAPTGTPATTSPHAPTPANTPMVSVQHPSDGGMTIPQQPQQQHHPQIPPMQQHHHPQPQPMNVAARSVSLPDMQSYAVKASQEEDKRRKRLARNRASARLRRLRKKNLVESYEGEVGVLESSLSKLRAHSWGTSDDHEALLEALSMERGQQNLSAEARRDLIRDILAQQREQVSNLMDAQLESMTLGWLVRRSHQAPPAVGGVVGDQKPSGEGVEKMKEDGDAVGGRKPAGGEDEERRKKEEDDLAKELEDVLQLTPQQAMQLQKATEGAEEERKAIRTVDMCLEAMMNNSWLLNQGVEECVEQFASILNPGQMSKFLLWTDHNSEAIDQLDYVNAPPASSPPSQTPSFVFGTDDCSHHDDADDGKGQTQHQQHHMQISTPQ